MTTDKRKHLSTEELALILGCEVEMIKKLGADSNKVGERKTLNYEFFRTICAWSAFDYIKPILRPISDITDEEVFEVCQITKPSPFLGNCPKSKWTIKREKDYIGISCPKNHHSFVIYTHKDTGYGDINIYIDGDELDQVNDMSFIVKYYLSKHFDIFGWIEEGLALDKTKITIANLK